MSITALERGSELVDERGFMTIRGANFIEALVRQVNENTPIIGTGSPEGVVTANPGRIYIDSSGAVDSVIYAKKTGTGDTGWST